MLIDRYLMREIGASTATVAIILTVIFLAYNLARFLTDAASGLLDAAEVMQLTGYKAVIALEVLLPLAFYFGIIVGCGRLNLHNELVVMRACGIPRRRLHRPLLLLGTLLATLVAVLSLQARPWAYERLFALKDRAESASELDRIKPQRFYLYEDDARTVYVEHIGADGGALRGVFIRTRGSEGIELITAPRATLDAFATPLTHRLILHEASVFLVANAPPDLLGRFAELTLSLDATRPIDREYRTKSAATLQLLGSPDDDDRAELHWRLSTPLSTLLLAACALMLVDQRPRESRFARLPLAVAIYAVYYNLLGVNRTWVEQQVVAGLWWAPALLAAALVLGSWWRRARGGLR
ncbi:MAG: LPS export ABC transporter permease LptF [Gammaproteobacteria bacterium]